MDWQPVIINALSITSISLVVATIRFWKQNKKLKENEVTQSDVNAQREQMNLGEDYIRKVMELSELNYNATLKNGVDNADIIKKVDSIAIEQKRLAVEQERMNGVQESMISFLNGNYQTFLREAEKKKKKN